MFFQKNKKYFLFLIVYFFCASGSFSKENNIIVNNGEIDLSNWNFAKEGSVELKGTWKFYYKKLVSNGTDLSKEEYSFLYSPGLWNNSIQNGKKISGIGYGTYKLNLILGSNGPSLAIKMTDVATSYNLWVNKKKILSNGKISDKANSYQPKYLPSVILLENLQQNNEIIIEVANFKHSIGGLRSAPIIGKAEELIIQKRINTYIDIFLVGSLLVVAIYNMFMFYFHKKDRASLYFSLFALAIIFRIILINEKPLYQIFPDFNWYLGNKIEYISSYLSNIFFLLFINSIFSKYLNKKILKTLFTLFGAGILVVIFFPLYYYSKTMFYFEISMIAAGIWVLTVILRALKNKKSEALLVLIGFISLFLAVINDILYNERIINTFHLAHWGLFAFMILQTGNISMRFSKTLSFSKKIAFELDIAKKVQETVLTFPDYYNNIKEFEIAVVYLPQNNKVGGDYYNINQLEDKSVSIIIADAIGHGIQAALRTMQIHSLYKQNYKPESSTQTLKNMNKNILEGKDVSSQNYFTAFLINIKKDEILFSSAGHPAQYLYKSKTKELKTLHTKGKILGVIDDTEIEFKKEKIENGDIIFLFTDGLFEQLNEKGTEFSEKKLYTLFEKSIHNTPENNLEKINLSVINEINRFKGKKPYTDDITLISIRVR
ncbi:MAG: SpoIIE family protein phosphatase [Spirochaetia bacterium]|nr:SpoIIE family protein phosphatase [Spirochaetia bacterium]